MKGNFNNLINGPVPVLIDFYADWCGPCKALAPILKALSKEVKGKVRIVKIDVDKNPNIASKFSVRSIPTMAFFVNGELKWKEAGMKTKQELLSLLASAL